MHLKTKSKDRLTDTRKQNNINKKNNKEIL